MQNSGNKIISVNDFGKMTDATRPFALNCLRKGRHDMSPVYICRDNFGPCKILWTAIGNLKLKPEVLYKSSFSIAGLTYSGHDTDEIFRLCKIKVKGPL